MSSIDHPAHYGGKDNPYEAIKVIEAWDLGFTLGNCVKYISRAGKKGDALEDLQKAKWCLDREVSRLVGLRMLEQQAEMQMKKDEIDFEVAYYDKLPVKQEGGA
jgi:hypothetical protein